MADRVACLHPDGGVRAVPSRAAAEPPPALQPVLSGRSRRRPARKAARAVRRVRRLFAGSASSSSTCRCRRTSATGSAIAGGWAPDSVALRSDHLRGAQHYKQSRQRRAADNAERHDSFPCRIAARTSATISVPRISPTGRVRQITQFHRFRHRFRSIVARCDCLPGRRPVISARSRIGEKRGGERPGVIIDDIDAASALRQKAEKLIAAGARIADGQARGVRCARRRGDASCRAPRRAEPLLTRTPGNAERYPRWSPDGNTVAYWSDRSGGSAS